MQSWLVAFARCSMMVAVWSVALTTLAGQAPRPTAARGSAPSGASAPNMRTPWGAPDLQTDQEYANRVAQSERQVAEALNEIDVFTIDTSNAGAVGSPTSPPPHWLERSTASRRTSLVIDPPDGRVPPITPQARARLANQTRGSFGD